MDKKFPPARKKLGQHFLYDPKVAEKIVCLANLPPDAIVLEIGAGRGILTRALLDNSHAVITAIEKDKGLISLLQPLVAQYPDRIDLQCADGLDWRLPTTTLRHRWDVVANLPYNVASQLLVNFCQQHFFYRQWVLMFQKEVALRLVAKSGDSSFGRLSILLATVGRAEILFTLAPSAFRPPPKVMSAVVKITINQTPLPCDIEKLGRLTNILFQQRRKQMHHGLTNICGDRTRAKELLLRLGVDDKIRAEDLALEKFWQLTNMMGDDINQR